MADSVEMQDIRGLDIDKAVKGFSLVDYTLKQDCTISSCSGDAIRWYKETAADLTNTPPQQFANVSPLSEFPFAEVTWSRETSYPRKYAVKGFISMEDIKTADPDVLARTFLRLTRAVMKEVDSRIYTVISTATGIGTAAATGTGWDDLTNGNPILDILKAKQEIYANHYNPEGATLLINQAEYTNLFNWLISVKGSSIPSFSSEAVRSGTVMSILGLNVKVNANATTDQALVFIPKQTCTWKTVFGTTGVTIDHPGMGKEIRVWEMGEAIATDPDSAYLITDTVT